MSYDLRIWSSKKLLGSNALLAENGYKVKDFFFILEGENWQVVIDQSNNVEPEDIPDEITQSLPGIAYSTEINIEGVASEKNIRGVLRFCKTLAKDIKGIVEDPQTDTIFLPAGMKKVSYENMPKDNREEVSLNWYFDDVEDFYSSKVKLLINLFERLLPDALPKRYGEYEPPQFKLAEKGKEHLIDFLQNEGHNAVLYPSKPFTYLGISVPNIEREAKKYFNGNSDKKEAHPESFYARIQREYRCGHIKLQMLQGVFLQPDWNLAVKRLFVETAKLLQPFFAEVTTGLEEEYLRKQGFIPSWWWRGLPHNSGYAAILSDKYINQWNKFRNAATEINNSLWMVDNFGQTECTNITKKVGKIPPQIIAPQKKRIMGWPFKISKTPYAKFFPFQA